MIGPEAMATAAVVSGACAGFFGWQAWNARMRAQRMRACVISKTAPGDRQLFPRDAVIVQMARLSTLLEHGQARMHCPSRAASSAWFVEHLPRSGLAGTVSEEAFCEMRLRLASVLAACGAMAGCLFSSELAFVLACVGAVVGWRLPARSVRRQCEERTQRVEAHLPEMLDVLALGMGSGLSFDAAVRLYCAHFPVEAAQDLERAQHAWTSGLERRDEALRRFAASYGSSALMRVVEAWIRSLRFGTSMVESLAAESAQARATCKAKREERIAKAPVKMMVPTGVLILPAMLALVLGPVLLELMNGGF